MIVAVLIILFLLLALVVFLLMLHQARCIRWLKRQVKDQGQELDRAFNRCGRLNERVSELEDAEEQKKEREEETDARVSALEESEEKRKKREEELAEAETQIQKAQQIEKLWQSGMEHIQAYDYDAARKAVTGNAGE